MSARQSCVALCAAVLAGCSAPKLSSSLPAGSPAVSYVGTSAGVLSAPAASVELDELQQLLRGVARGADAGPVEFARDGTMLILRLGAQGTFGAESAQLQPFALEFYAQLAAVLKARPGSVLHILVTGPPASGEPATELFARRATSVQDYLAANGVPGTRLRAEGRPEDGERIELVLKPVVSGAETQAWVPPS